MKVDIQIECDEPNEICQHLDHLFKAFKKAAKNNAITEGFTLSDANCYGEHTATVTEYE